MQNYYFSAKIQQEFANCIYQTAIDIGISSKNIVFNPQSYEILYLGLYIKFTDHKLYENFCSLQIPSIVEVW